MANPSIYLEIDASELQDKVNALKAVVTPERFNQIMYSIFQRTGGHVKMILRHAQMLCDCKGERVGMREMRGHVHNYLTGFPGASKVRKKVNSITTLAELQTLLAKEYPYA